jgi:Resolvase, N terminal domain
MFQMMGVFAEFERSMIREQVNAGIARAKAAGKQVSNGVCGSLTRNQLDVRALSCMPRPSAPGRWQSPTASPCWRGLS